MNTYENKVVLIAGNLNLFEVSIIQHILDGGAKEVRILGGNETIIQSLREQLLSKKPDAISRLRCYISALGESDYNREAAMGANLVLCLPSVCPNEDCERNPADACLALLEPVENFIRLATKIGAEKVVVVSPTRQVPLATLPDMITDLMETVVIAEGRYLGKESKTAIVCARQDGDLCELADYAFAKGTNADLMVQSKEIIERNSCDDFDFKRE